MVAKSTRGSPGRKASERMEAPATPFETCTKLRPWSSLRKRPSGVAAARRCGSRSENATALISLARPRARSSQLSPPSRLTSRPCGVAAASSFGEAAATWTHARMRVAALHPGGEPSPVAAVHGPEEDAVVGSGQDHLVLAFPHRGQRQHLAAFEARAERNPLPVRGGGEHAAVPSVVADRGHDAAPGRSHDRGDEPRGEAVVRRREGPSGVPAAQHSGAVGAEQHDPAGKGQDRVDHQLLGGEEPPGSGAVVAAPEAFGGARVERVRRRGVLGEGAGAPAARRDAADARPQAARVQRSGRCRCRRWRRPCRGPAGRGSGS